MPHLMQSPPSVHTTIDGKEYLYFSGTGYLGLHGHPKVIDAAIQATRQFGLGSGTARSGYGTTPPTEEVERRAAQFFGTEDAFYFPTGYLGSSVLVKALAGTFDLIIHDEAIHYSSRDAAALSGKPVVTFRTRDPEHLAEVLQTQVNSKTLAGSGVRPLLLVDGVFPVRGTISPIGPYIKLLSDYPDAAMIVDDAHALGVLGQRGRGSYEHLGIDLSEVNTGKAYRAYSENAASDRRLARLPATGSTIKPVTGDRANKNDLANKNEVATRLKQGPRLFVCGTMSKAFGGYGGIVFGSREFITHLKQTSPYFNGASALPPAAAAATAESLRLLEEDLGLLSILKRLRENVDRARAGLRQLGLAVEPTPTPVICLELGTADEMRRIQETLSQRGILISYQPTYSDLGPEGALRIAIFATHTPAMIDELVETLGKTLQPSGSLTNTL